MTEHIDPARLRRVFTHEQAEVRAKLLHTDEIVDRWLEAYDARPGGAGWNREHVGSGSDRHLDEMEQAMARRRQERVRREGR